MVPELLVSNLAASLSFWVSLVGFSVRFDRPDGGFAYLEGNGAAVMLEEFAACRRQWLTGPMEPPYGRGINFQIDVDDVEAIIGRLAAAAWPLYRPVADAWYRAGDLEHGQRQFLVQDPDGYLLRLAQHIGDRPAASQSGPVCG